MGLNYTAILIAAALQFIFGAIWYTLIFGKLWGRMHGFDKLSKAVQRKMMSQMGPIYVLQFFVTLVMTLVVAIIALMLPQSLSVYTMASLLWIGLVVPTIVSSVLFGGTESKWIIKKIAVQAGASFFYLQIAVLVLDYFK